MNDTINGYVFDDLILASMSDAEEIVTNTLALFDKYGQVSVADIYDMGGIISSFTDNKMGWTHLNRGNISITGMETGYYCINMPKPTDL